MTGFSLIILLRSLGNQGMKSIIVDWGLIFGGVRINPAMYAGGFSFGGFDGMIKENGWSKNDKKE